MDRWGWRTRGILFLAFGAATVLVGIGIFVAAERTIERVDCGDLPREVCRDIERQNAIALGIGLSLVLMGLALLVASFYAFIRYRSMPRPTFPASAPPESVILEVSLTTDQMYEAALLNYRRPAFRVPFLFLGASGLLLLGVYAGEGYLWSSSAGIKSRPEGLLLAGLAILGLGYARILASLNRVGSQRLQPFARILLGPHGILYDVLPTRLRFVMDASWRDYPRIREIDDAYYLVPRRFSLRPIIAIPKASLPAGFDLRKVREAPEASSPSRVPSAPP